MFLETILVVVYLRVLIWDKADKSDVLENQDSQCREEGGYRC